MWKIFIKKCSVLLVRDVSGLFFTSKEKVLHSPARKEKHSPDIVKLTSWLVPRPPIQCERISFPAPLSQARLAGNTFSTWMAYLLISYVSSARIGHEWHWDAIYVTSLYTITKLSFSLQVMIFFTSVAWREQQSRAKAQANLCWHHCLHFSTIIRISLAEGRINYHP